MQLYYNFVGQQTVSAGIPKTDKKQSEIIECNSLFVVQLIGVCAFLQQNKKKAEGLWWIIIAH